MKYTPGPWGIGSRKATYTVLPEMAKKLQAYGLPTEFKALSVGTSRGQVAIIPLDESNVANARLIAAAPELLEIAKRYELWEAKLLETSESWGSEDGLPQFTQELFDEWIELQTLRNLAIAKANGKQ